MKPKKKRVIWMAEPDDNISSYHLTNGLITGLSYHAKKIAKLYGKPVKFIEA